MTKHTSTVYTVYPIAGDTDTTTQDVMNCIFVDLLAKARGLDTYSVPAEEADRIVGAIWAEVKAEYYNETGRNMDIDRGWA